MTTKKRKYSSNLSNRVSKLEKVAKQVEKKFKDQTSAGTVTATAGFILLNGLLRGDTHEQRDGQRVHLESLNFNMTYKMDTASLETVLKIFIVQDKQPNQVTMDIAELLNTATVIPTVALRNVDNIKRFIVHHHMTFTMDSTGKKSGHYHKYIKLNIDSVYDTGNAGTIADLTTNALFLVLVSDDSIEPPIITQQTRLRYTDL